VLVTREPGGSPRAEQIRAFLLGGGAKRHGPLAEAVLFSAARADHLEQTIRPALASGTHVLCDRFADSTRAYQGARGALDERVIAMLERVAVDGTEPDLTVILDLPAERGLARAQARRQEKGEGADRFEAEDAGFHEALRQTFLTIAKDAPERCVIVDADGDPVSVQRAVWAAVTERLPELARTPRAAAHVA
jgi:dTMP kinase